MIPVRDAVKQKGCTRATVINAIHRGEIDAERFGNVWAIVQNKKYEEWQPSVKHQDSGRARWSTSKAKKSRKSA